MNNELESPLRHSRHPANPPGTQQSVIAVLSYLKPTAERPFSYAYEPPPGVAWENCEYELRPTTIADARHVRDSVSIDAEGFELRDAPTAMTNFLDEEDVKKVYYAEAAELALAVTGAKEAYVFDHLAKS